MLKERIRENLEAKALAAIGEIIFSGNSYERFVNKNEYSPNSYKYPENNNKSPSGKNSAKNLESSGVHNVPSFPGKYNKPKENIGSNIYSSQKETEMTPAELIPSKAKLIPIQPIKPVQPVQIEETGIANVKTKEPFTISGLKNIVAEKVMSSISAAFGHTVLRHVSIENINKVIASNEELTSALKTPKASEQYSTSTNPLEKAKEILANGASLQKIALELPKLLGYYDVLNNWQESLCGAVGIEPGTMKNNEKNIFEEIRNNLIIEISQTSNNFKSQMDKLIGGFNSPEKNSLWENSLEKYIDSSSTMTKTMSPPVVNMYLSIEDLGEASANKVKEKLENFAGLVTKNSIVFEGMSNVVNN